MKTFRILVALGVAGVAAAAACGGSTTDTSGGSGDDAGVNHPSDASGGNPDATGTWQPDAATTTPSNQPTPCGDAGTCDPATQACCITFGSESCIAKGGTCQMGIAASCLGAANCPAGQVCCLGQQGTSTACATSCMGVQVCQTNAECPPGDECTMVFGGNSVCRPARGDGGFPRFDGGFPRFDGGFPFDASFFD